jgi:hypothetical protein
MPTGIPYQVNDEDRLTLAKGLQLNVPLEKIARTIGVSTTTLENHYSDVIEAAMLKRGPKPFEPTEQERQIVRMAAAVGMPHEKIGLLLRGLSKGSVETHFKEELEQGSAQADFKVGGALFKTATADPPVQGTVAAQIWWTKARMGWKDTSRVENTGADGGPIQNQTQGQVVVWLPDNGRGDCTAPVVQAPPPDARAIEEDLTAGEGDPSWLMKP